MSRFIIIICILLASELKSQTLSSIKGVVTDGVSGEALSFVSVSIKNRSVGTLTDDDGKFNFKAKIKAGDSLLINYVGYTSQTLALSLKTGQNFNIELKEASYHLNEVLVTADPNPGNTLMRKVIKQNVFNDPEKLKRIYSRRWELKEVNLFDPKADELNPTKGIIFGDKAKTFAKLRKADDTLIKQTPLFFAERITDYELTRTPFSESEREVAVKTTGFDTDIILENLVKWSASDINLYSDWVLLFNKTFVSPVGKDAFSYYNFYIVDSVSLPQGFYNITFQAIPKDWRDNVFTGYFTVNDSSFALISADLKLSKDANINFIEAIRIQQTYSPALDVSTGIYRYTLSESILSLKYPANLESFGIPIPISLGDKELVCKIRVKNSGIILNTLKASDFAKSGGLVTSRKLFDTGHDDAYWDSIRPDTLSSREAAIYIMANHLNNDIQAKAKEKLISTVFSGVYYVDKKLYIGPLGSLFSYNRIEGFRLRLSVRTMEDIFPRTGIYGHMAYGFKDKRVKTNLGVRHVWSTQPYSRSQLSHYSDYDVGLEWYDQADKDNYLNSILRKNVPYYRIFNKQWLFTHDQQLGANFLMHLGINYQNMDPSFPYSYPNPAFISVDQTPNEPINIRKVDVADITIGLKFAWHESAKMFNYTRVPLTSKYPVAIVSFTQGVKLNSSYFDYQRLSLNLSHNTRLSPKIEFNWNVEVGKVFGVTPTLILHQPTGNDAWVLSSRVFNLMTPFEFTADRYAQLVSSFNLGGIFFDKIPLVKKLKLRERLLFNSFWGDLNSKNRQFNNQLTIFTADQKPYMEWGAGIDNIFHLFSITYLRRVNYFESPGAKVNRHGLFAGIKVLF